MLLLALILAKRTIVLGDHAINIIFDDLSIGVGERLGLPFFVLCCLLMVSLFEKLLQYLVYLFAAMNYLHFRIFYTTIADRTHLALVK
jgi:hypothetical protein